MSRTAALSMFKQLNLLNWQIGDNFLLDISTVSVSVKIRNITMALVSDKILTAQGTKCKMGKKYLSLAGFVKVTCQKLLACC